MNFGRAFISLTIVIAVTGTDVRASEMKHCLELTQKHCFFGKCLLTVNSDAIRLDVKEGLHFTMVALKPSWTVSVFRADEKSYFSEPLNQLFDTGLVSGIMLNVRPRNFSRYQPQTFWVKTFGFKMQKQIVSWSTIICFPSTEFCSLTVERIINSAYKVTTGGGIPVDCRENTKASDFFAAGIGGERTETMLSTSAVKEVDRPIEFFQVPRGYTQRKSLTDVVSGNTAKDFGEEWLKATPQR